MEARLREAAAAGTPVLVVRAGDFFGPRAGNNWFSQGLVKPGQPSALDHPARRPRRRPRLGLPARRRRDDGAARRGRRAAAASPASTWTATGTPTAWRWPTAIRARPRRARLPLRRFPWPLLRLAGPLVPLFRELAEMRYLWRAPVRLDNRRLLAALGDGAAHAARPGGPRDARRSRLPARPGRAAVPAREAPRISYRQANLDSFTLQRHRAPTVREPGTRPRRGQRRDRGRPRSGRPGGGRQLPGLGARAGRRQPARFLPRAQARFSAPSRRCASRAAARRCAANSKAPAPSG